LGKTGFRGEIGLERFPITWNPETGKEPLKINKLGQVLLEKVERLSTRPLRAAVGSEHGFHGVFHVAFG
jgi:hypothetical protein